MERLRTISEIYGKLTDKRKSTLLNTAGYLLEAQKNKTHSTCDKSKNLS